MPNNFSDTVIFYNLPSGTYSVHGRREFSLPGGVVCVSDNDTTVTIQQSAADTMSLSGHIKTALRMLP
ncbi:MAG: hypothetical protein IPL53_03950 [Ignavibacteria bacterium]|nr:hypothetical protein [Ignavibacteria bacterium]